MNTYIEQIKNLSTNKYARVYINLCISRTSFPHSAETQTELHHILPKCFLMGGETDKLNLVRLTPREHFVAHTLLSKMFSDKKKRAQMQKAVSKFLQSTIHQSRILTSHQYEFARRCASKSTTTFNTGSKKSEKTRQLMSENNAANLDTTKTAIAKTKLEKYGTPAFNNPAKAQQTKLEKYGHSYVNPAKAQQTKLEKYGTPAFNNQEKRKATSLEKYGTNCPSNQKSTCPYCDYTSTKGWVTQHIKKNHL